MRRATPAILLTAAYFVAPLASRTNAEGRVALDDIRVAWERRAEKVRSARVEWTTKESIMKGTWHSGPANRNYPESGDIPPADISLDVGRRLLLDGSKMRLERQDPVWHGRDKGILCQPYVCTFDGTICKGMRVDGGPGKAWPQGWIEPQAYHEDANQLELRPLMLTLRGRIPGRQTFDLNACRVTGRRATISGRGCFEIEGGGERGSATQYWLDLERDFVLTRFVRGAPEKPATQIDVQYKQDAVAGWVPESWHVRRYDETGHLVQAWKAKVSVTEINMPIPPDEFELVFPRGTVVCDIKTNDIYVVQPDGTGNRPVLGNEVFATYEQVISTEPGEAFGPRPRPLRRWLWIVAGAAVVVVAFVIWHRSRRVQGDAGSV